MSFAATWMDLETVIVSKSEGERQIPYITYTQNVKYDTNELIYEAETDSQTQRTDLWLPREREEGVGWTGSFGLVDENYDIQNG